MEKVKTAGLVLGLDLNGKIMCNYGEFVRSDSLIHAAGTNGKGSAGGTSSRFDCLRIKGI